MTIAALSSNSRHSSIDATQFAPTNATKICASKFATQFALTASGLGLLLTLAACGSGSNQAASGVDAPTSGTNTPTTVAQPSPVAQSPVTDLALGSITGFGSVIVNGVKYDDATTTVSIDSDAEKPFARTTTDLKIGMQVELKHNGATASDVLVSSALRGPVTSVDAPQTTLIILGQKVLVDTNGADATVLDGFATFAEIKAGDWVEVHATESADGTLKASRIERESPAQSTAIKLAGKLTALDSAAKTFKVGATTINFTNSMVRPSAATLANDQRVYVYSDSQPVAGIVNAKKIRVRDAKLSGVALTNVAGLVSDFISAADFKVSGIKVNATAAKFENGALIDIINGAAVRIKGVVKDGVINASEIEFKKKSGAQAAVISIKGTVGDFVSISSFKLRGQAIDASGATFEGGKASDLANGSFIELQAQLINGQIKAVKITFIAQDKEGLALNISGLVQNYDQKSKTLTIAGTAFKMTDSTSFVGGLLADLANGKLIEVAAIRKAGTFEIGQLTFKNMATIPLYLRGVAYDVSVTNFKLAGVTISIDSQTKFIGGVAADLVNGSNVSLQAKLLLTPDALILPAAGSTGTALPSVTLPILKAVQIELLQRPKLDASLSIEGAVSDFISISSLRVAGQRVDASAAIIEGGVIADIANGKVVKVTGQVVEGVVKATKLTLRGA